jgi:hypothetical protein
LRKPGKPGKEEEPMKHTANEYLVTRQNGNTHYAVVKDIRSAAEAFEDGENPVVQISRTRVGLDVLTDDPEVMVEFSTAVTPAGAVSAGCLATPRAFTVPGGAPVIFEAVPAAGWNFAGWFRNGVELSQNAVAVFAMVPPDDTETGVVYEAKFEPV